MSRLRQAIALSLVFARGIHDDRRGAMSLVSVFALLVLVMLLGMVINSSRQVDQKIKVQNAADSSAHGGVFLVELSI
jgi:Flp pilus assembly protein TadG